MTTFVLVPGAWLGGWTWSKVVPGLRRQGHEAYPVTLTGMGERVHLLSESVGMDTAVNDVLNVVKYNGLDDIVLVGHSFAGKVAAAVADRIPERVGTVLYLDSFRPEKVKTPQGGFDPSGEFGPLPPGKVAFPLTEEIVNRIGPDVVGSDRRWLMYNATPWPKRLATDPITLTGGIDSVRCAYIFCKQSGDPVEEIIAGKWGKLEGPYRVEDAGHWPMITRPEDLARDLIELSVR